jgi:hypothetical protein
MRAPEGLLARPAHGSETIDDASLRGMKHCPPHRSTCSTVSPGRVLGDGDEGGLGDGDAIIGMI